MTTIPNPRILADIANAVQAGGDLGTPASGSLANCTGLPEGGIALSDNTTGDVSTTKHGFVPKAPNDSQKFLRGDATWAPVPAAGGTTFNVTNYGAVADGTMGAYTGTDNTAAFQAAIDAAYAASAAGKRQMVVVPPGVYRLASGIVIKGRVDFDMRGAHIVFSGAPGNLQAITIGETSLEQNSGQYLGLAIESYRNYWNPAYDDNWVGVRVINTNRSYININWIAGFGCGMQFLPGTGGNESVANNTVVFTGLIAYCRYALDLRDNLNTGFVNENCFYNFEYSATSTARFLGPTFGVRFSHENGATPQQNNNRFYGATFQVGVHYTALKVGLKVYPADNYYNPNNGRRYTYAGTSDPLIMDSNFPTHSDLSVQGGWQDYGVHDFPNDLLTGMTPTVGYRYRNPSNGRSYYCKSGSGTVSVLPTHTSGDAVAGSHTWTYDGYYLKCPVYHQNGGGSANEFVGCRWESGHGPFAFLENCGNSSGGNLYDVYALDHNSWFSEYKQAVYHAATTSKSNGSVNNQVKTYVSKPDPVFTIPDVHLRAVFSGANGTGGLAIRGMCFMNGNVNHMASGMNSYLPATLSTPNRIGVDWISGVRWPFYLGVLIDVRRWKGGGNNLIVKRFEFGAETHYANPNYAPKVFALNDSFGKLLLTDIGDTDVSNIGLVKTIGSSVDFFGAYSQGTSVPKTLLFEVSPEAYTTPSGLTVNDVWPSNGIAYLFAGVYIAGDPAILKSFTVRGFGDGFADQTMRVFSTSNETARTSYGAPTLGHFPSKGELIRNLNTTAGQPIGHYVSTVGVMALAWASATLVYEGELRSNGGNIYQAVDNKGTWTTGTQAPTGTGSGTFDDDMVLWRYYCPVGACTATTEVYP